MGQGGRERLRGYAPPQRPRWELLGLHARRTSARLPQTPPADRVGSVDTAPRWGAEAAAVSTGVLRRALSGRVTGRAMVGLRLQRVGAGRGLRACVSEARGPRPD